MMKYTRIIALALMLTACNSAYITPAVYNTAVEWCSNHKGLKLARYEYYDRERYTIVAVCNDMAVVEKIIQGQP